MLPSASAVIATIVQFIQQTVIAPAPTTAFDRLVLKVLLYPE
jgi:hypothetical protein